MLIVRKKFFQLTVEAAKRSRTQTRETQGTRYQPGIIAAVAASLQALIVVVPTGIGRQKKLLPSYVLKDGQVGAGGELAQLEALLLRVHDDDDDQGHHLLLLLLDQLDQCVLVSTYLAAAALLRVAACCCCFELCVPKLRFTDNHQL